MKPYDQIRWKSAIKWSTFYFCTIVFAGFLLVKPIMHCQQALGYAFANPTLWLLDLEHLMWEKPIHINRNGAEEISVAGGFCCLISFIAHIVAFIFSIIGLVELHDRAKKSSRRW